MLARSARPDALIAINAYGETVRGKPSVLSGVRPWNGRARASTNAGAMCVRLVDDRFVLRFTFLLAVRLGLPRPASQVIHRSEPYTRS